MWPSRTFFVRHPVPEPIRLIRHSTSKHRSAIWGGVLCPSPTVSGNWAGRPIWAVELPWQSAPHRASLLSFVEYTPFCILDCWDFVSLARLWSLCLLYWACFVAGFHPYFIVVYGGAFLVNTWYYLGLLVTPVIIVVCSPCYIFPSTLIILVCRCFTTQTGRDIHLVWCPYLFLSFILLWYPFYTCFILWSEILFFHEYFFFSFYCGSYNHFNFCTV